MVKISANLWNHILISRCLIAFFEIKCKIGSKIIEFINTLGPLKCCYTVYLNSHGLENINMSYAGSQITTRGLIIFCLKSDNCCKDRTY